MPAELLYYEDFYVGQEIDIGSRVVVEDEMLAFAHAYDPQPFHVDPVKARTSIFGTIISSGWFTASLYMSLLVDGLLNNTASQGSPGLDNVRWLKPVYAGDALHGSARMLEMRVLRSRPTIGLVKMEGTLRNQHGEVVFTLISNGLFSRRPDVVDPSETDAAQSSSRSPSSSAHSSSSSSRNLSSE